MSRWPSYDTLSDIVMDAKSASKAAEKDLEEYYPKALLLQVQATLNDLAMVLISHELGTKVITQQRTKAAAKSVQQRKKA